MKPINTNSEVHTTWKLALYQLQSEKKRTPYKASVIVKENGYKVHGCD